MISKRRIAGHAAILAAAAILVACGSEPALLVSPRLDGAPPLGVVSDPAGAPVRPVRRQTALADNRSWSFDVGPDGTVARDGSTGLTITVPPAAVAKLIRITVTALKGEALAYRFEPHGLQFGAPVQLTQKLNGLKVRPTSLGVPELFAGYFADDTLATDSQTGEARVIEILPVQIDVRNQAAILHIRHFSGYTVASADADSSVVDQR